MEGDSSSSDKLIMKVCGIDPEKVAKKLVYYSDGKNPEMTLSSSDGETVIELQAHDEGGVAARKVLKGVVKEIKSILGEKIYTTDPAKTLEESVVGLLQANNLSVSTAESCTAGMVAARLANVPGFSEVFSEGFITYSNKSKRKYTGVRKSTLDKFSAVSAETAQEMARGCVSETKADCAVAVTGYAGPDGGTKKQPVGTVYIGVCIQKKIVVKEYHLEGDRQQVRRRAVTEALSLLRRCLLEYFSEVTFGEKKK